MYEFATFEIHCTVRRYWMRGKFEIIKRGKFIKLCFANCCNPISGEVEKSEKKTFLFLCTLRRLIIKNKYKVTMNATRNTLTRFQWNNRGGVNYTRGHDVLVHLEFKRSCQNEKSKICGDKVKRCRRDQCVLQNFFFHETKKKRKRGRGWTKKGG